MLMSRKFRLQDCFVSILVFLLLLVFNSHGVFSQVTSYREQIIIQSKTDTIPLDSLTIYPNSLQLFCGGNKNTQLSRSDYEVDLNKNVLILYSRCTDTLLITYRVLPINLRKVYGNRDTNLIYTQQKGNREKFLITEKYTSTDIFGNTGINKSGSISRGVSFGNNQNLAVNSSLNLELSGDLAPNLKILASVSDNNLPIQADGNTNKLQEFDQVFIQIYNDRFKLIAGDFWLKKPEGYFMTYRKRAQGLTAEYKWGKDTLHVWKTQVSGALSKGKFNRQIITGIEGNQGPYRLIGNENEPYIIILAGTENVYIDGRLLKRGQEYDYTINYNSAEVIFTSRNQITKDSRIVVEFQYSAQNYTRSLFQSSTSYSSEKLNFWLNTYSEQDVKNQPLQQTLSFQQKQLLAGIGDKLDEARSLSIDSVGYLDNQNLYALIDSLGYDSILVFSVDKNKAYFKATFQFVGAGKGDYVFSNFGAFGKVYKWVAPLGGVHQGDYAPFRLIYTPKQKQMVTIGTSYQITKKLKIESEAAYSKNDLNTFSPLDSRDDQSGAIRTRLLGAIPLGRNELKKWELQPKFEVETLDKNFSPIEQYRAVEFDRDWNTRNKGYLGNQLATTVGTNFKNSQFGNLNFEGQQFLIGTDYNGLRSKISGKWNQKGFAANWDGSYLSSTSNYLSTTKNDFIRHKVDVSKKVKYITIGFKDDHEKNTFHQAGILQTTSYQFYDYQFYLTNGDSTKNSFRLFYRERFDQRSDSARLLAVAKAKTAGGEIRLMKLKNQSLNIVTSYRELKVVNTTLLNQTPENTLLGRIDYELRAFKGALTWNNFYELGSGLELKREIVYIKVNDGQGVYTWIDYNNDGVKDLNEFEIAQYIDQASYIRIFSPSNQYIKTYSNELNQGLFWKPERIWSAKKGVFYRIASRFSNQTRVRVSRKTNVFDNIDAFNPFSSKIQDLNLISTMSNSRNTLYFNRSSTIFGGEYTYQDTRSKSLLASGFDSKQTTYNEIALRWNIKRIFTIESSLQQGVKISKVDYVTGRDFSLNYALVKSSVIFQPTTTFRISIDGRFSEKKNAKIYGGDISTVKELGSTFKYNQAEKGSFQGGMSLINIRYSGSQNSALGFEMLEALRPGINYTWNVSYQRSVSQKLQISIQYNGRKSTGNRMIHSGGMEVRAFF